MGGISASCSLGLLPLLPSLQCVSDGKAGISSPRKEKAEAEKTMVDARGCVLSSRQAHGVKGVDNLPGLEQQQSGN